MRARGMGMAAVFAAVAGFIIWKLTRPPAVEVAQVLRGTAVEAVYASGTVQPIDVVEVKARVSGAILALKAREGSFVHQDDLLAIIDAPSLRHDVERGRADLVAAQSRASWTPQLAALQATEKSIRDQWAQARTDMDRVAGLVSKGASPTQDLDRQRVRLTDIESQLAANQAEQRDTKIAMRADTERAQAGVASLQAKALDAEVRAPLSGVVLKLHVDPGEVVAVNHDLMRIGDIERLHIEAEVDEADVGKIREGATAAVRLYAFDKRVFRGNVTKISPAADETRNSFEVHIELAERVQGLRPGMTSEVNIILEQKDNTLLVPTDAVHDNKVWIVSSGRLHERTVTTGIRDLSQVEIESGLREGEWVASGDTVPFREGMRISSSERDPKATIQR